MGPHLATSGGVDNISFEYWSDPLCIWAFVAQPRLEHVLEEWGAEVDVQYHVVPVFGSVAQRFRDGAWAKGGPEARAAATRHIAEKHGAVGVTGEGWLRDCPASSWPAGAAVKAAFEMEADHEADPGLAADFQLALRRRFFVANENIARRVVQLSVAEAVRLPRGPLERRLDDGTAWAALLEDHQRKETLRIQGSPAYVFDGGRAQLYGNFPQDILEATVESLVRGLDPGCSTC